MIKATSNKILFISNEASRSGAPIVLLHLLNWLKQNTPLQFDILLLNGGPLQSEFKKLGDTYLLNELVNLHSYTNRFRKKVFKSDLNKKLKKVAAKLAKKQYDLVYGNTILSLPWLQLFKQHHNLKTLCCIHELSFALNYCFAEAYLNENLNLTDGIIAVSAAVKDNLRYSYQIPEEKISLHYEFIDTNYQSVEDTAVTRKSLNINKDVFIIGAGGTPEWRKGVDLALPLALTLAEKHPDLNFKIAWLGADQDSHHVKHLLYDAEKCGITDKFCFIPNSDKPLDIINLFDVFISLSREDPFPLIALEAAFLKKPVIAFEKSGGMPELLKQGAGFTVPYLDLDKAAAIIYQLSNDTALLKKTGTKAEELITSHYSTGNIAPEIYAEIMNLIAK
ncbi:hypothetical protein A0256_10565 [Mucilaginibacter sp. PAMC 26640]|nr:hypothetical protein A0256_10565 [Mucilaginibacter sp. PAMC 26640]